MSKMYIIALVTALSFVSFGCSAGGDGAKDVDTATKGQDDVKATEDGEAAAQQGSESEVEDSGEKSSQSDEESLSLAVPKVMEGVTMPGEDAVEVRFDWDAVDGAEGYEVCAESKYCEEEEYREPEVSEVLENYFVTGAQDDFDFRIKVRAFAGEGDGRKFGEWSEYAIGRTYDITDASGREDTEAENTSPFVLWEYEGYVDECDGYTWQKEFLDCDYDGDGKRDRVNRSCDTDEQTAVYTVEFGNGDELTVPKGWDTGFPHVQGGDLDDDGENEILVTLSYDTSTDPFSFGDMWLFDKDASGRYREAELPLADGENGAKGLTVDYEKPVNGKIRYEIKEAGLSREEEVGEEYISSWWSDDATSQMRSVYSAVISGGSDPVLRCYIAPFPREGLSLGFNLNYRKGRYEIGYIEIDSP